MSNHLDELTAAAAEAAKEYDEALAAGAPEDELAELRGKVSDTERARAYEEWKQQQHEAGGDHLEFDGFTVTNIGVEPTEHTDEVM